MHSDIEESRARTPIVKRAGAGLVLIAAAALAIHVLFNLILTVFWIIVGVAAVLAVLWAVRTISS
jgi:hypothetical protein